MCNLEPTSPGISEAVDAARSELKTGDAQGIQQSNQSKIAGMAATFEGLATSPAHALVDTGA